MLSTCEQVDSFPSPLPSLELLCTHLGLFCLAGIYCKILKTFISKDIRIYKITLYIQEKSTVDFFSFFPLASTVLNMYRTIESKYVVTIFNYNEEVILITLTR